MDDFKEEKRQFFEKINSVFESIGKSIERGDKPRDEIAWLEGLLAQTIAGRKWQELTSDEKRRFLSILRVLNLYREEMINEKPIGVPVPSPEDIDEYMKKKHEEIPDNFDPDRYYDYDPKHK